MPSPKPKSNPVAENPHKDAIEQLELAKQVIEQARDHLEEAAAVLEDTRTALRAEREDQNSSAGPAVAP